MFVRELDATLAVHSQYVLFGNLHDSFLIRDGQPRQLTLLPLLTEALALSGYSAVIEYDQVDGLSVHPLGDGATARQVLHDVLGSQARPDQRPSLETLRGYLASIARTEARRVAVVLNYASRLSRNVAALEQAEHDFFVFCAKLSRTPVTNRAAAQRPSFLHNPVIWLVEREGDLPAWFTAGNDMIRSISLPYPDFGDRQETARLLAAGFAPGRELSDEAHAEVCEAFAEQSEGLTLQGMIEVTRLARERGLALEGLPDAVRTYKLGVLENPWKRDYVRKRIAKGEEQVPERVIGQPFAVTKALDILKRAALGLSGAQAAKSSTRPRGVLFFAGPTGVGKTELAKTISSLVFGDEDAYLRFDMSEFSSEHAGDRLIGAPPGYVGYEQGGELTNAVRQHPFRVILFDEIEKAHPRILDKFLQILEDGRLTDGRGSTVHFSESILVFTSNLGMFVEDGTGNRVPNAEPGMPYDDMETRVKRAISDHFTRVLNRPELLNRFGDNIVVFDFIGTEAGGRIFDGLLRNILRRVADEHGVPLSLTADVQRSLRTWCTADLDKGGRGIGMALESYFVNPLARALFTYPLDTGAPITVSGIRRTGSSVELDLT
jgi:hypothetical protein